MRKIKSVLLPLLLVLIIHPNAHAKLPKSIQNLDEAIEFMPEINRTSEIAPACQSAAPAFINDAEGPIQNAPSYIRQSTVALSTVIRSDSGDVMVLGQCTGVITGYSTIVTAGHCCTDVARVGYASMMVRFPLAADGVVDGLKESSSMMVSADNCTIPDPEKDLCVIHTPKKVPAGFKPVAIAQPKSYFPKDLKITVAGFGITSSADLTDREKKDSANHPQLRYGYSNVGDNSKPDQVDKQVQTASGESYRGELIFGDSGIKKLFTKVTEPCHGDSGGPVFYEGRNGPELLAVVSMGEKCDGYFSWQFYGTDLRRVSQKDLTR